MDWVYFSVLRSRGQLSGRCELLLWTAFIPLWSQTGRSRLAESNWLKLAMLVAVIAKVGSTIVYRLEKLSQKAMYNCHESRSKKDGSGQNTSKYGFCEDLPSLYSCMYCLFHASLFPSLQGSRGPRWWDPWIFGHFQQIFFAKFHGFFGTTSCTRKPCAPHRDTSAIVSVESLREKVLSVSHSIRWVPYAVGIRYFLICLLSLWIQSMYRIYSCNTVMTLIMYTIQCNVP